MGWQPQPWDGRNGVGKRLTELTGGKRTTGYVEEADGSKAGPVGISSLVRATWCSCPVVPETPPPGLGGPLAAILGLAAPERCGGARRAPADEFGGRGDPKRPGW